MTREQREQFVRHVLDTNIANAVERIVERWERDVTEVYETSKLDPRDAIGNVGH